MQVTIERLGHRGDGVAHVDGRPVHIPFTLPGESVNAAVKNGRGEAVAILSGSPDRVVPPCEHFGTCGGCALQHLEEGAYREWKRRRVAEEIRARGLSAEVGPLVACAPASRRRAALTARRTEKGIILGYNRALSNTIVNIEECPVVVPEIVAALPIVRELADAASSASTPFRVLVTLTDSGLDMALADGGPLTDARRRLATALAVERGVARLSADGEIVVETRRPFLDLGSSRLEPPPGGFLQAVQSAEAAMADLVVGHIGKTKRVVDLFAGSGTFALRLARLAEVHAVEGDGAALAALDRSFRAGQNLRRVTVEKRDLSRRPLLARELERFGGLVFDPPRAGAEDQARQIARSDVTRVAAVSCNPVTLARDLEILVAGGYRLASVTAIDQFLWSPHVEAVALLEKPARRR